MQLAPLEGLSGAAEAVSRFRVASIRGSAAFFALLLAATGRPGDEAADVTGTAWLATASRSPDSAVGRDTPAMSKFSRRRLVSAPFRRG